MVVPLEESSQDYVVLNPHDGGIIDLLRLLLFRDIEKSKFVDCPEGIYDAHFKRRWLIFLSIIVQKFLNFVKKPLAWFGMALEMWLNLYSDNGNSFGLLMNILKWKVVIPDPKSARYRSNTAFMDNRIQLDKNLIYGDHRYYAAFSVMAAKLAYENAAFVEETVKNHWKMEFLGFYDYWNEYQELGTTQAFMLRDKRSNDVDLTVVSFRGTEMFDSDAWSTDFDLSWYEIPNVGKVHGGFMKALGLQKDHGWPKEILHTTSRPEVAYYSIRDKLREIIRENKKAKFIVTGHSLGGALAALFPVILAYHGETELLHSLEGVYTFGQPRVGDDKLAEFMEEQIHLHNVKFARYVYGHDMVPRLPYDDKTLMFKHFGTCVYYDRFYRGKIVKEEPNKNYFEMKWFIPKITNSFMEMVRSFRLRHQYGQEYDEGWFLLMFRTIGLAIPGISAHMPQDYVNCTRVGCLETLETLLPDASGSRPSQLISLN
ncbi:hypothetical protein C5167_038616 [Papaver somniferum]|uniref:Fungal lipase-type domain-containing protein n=1 Tax=Papaver somniferum TaxID=3469 RepID=A0A4Y7IDU0_PAPSO|nr:uncharacterized protein LOC113297882 [Papaver somniferum]RZC45668.1 hypothetical protein C5167_038616 [Papaver somniferum]